MPTAIIPSVRLRHACFAVWIALFVMHPNSASAQIIRIMDDEGVDLVHFFQDGNISILYGTILMGSDADLLSEPQAGEFLIRNDLGEIVFRVSPDMGHIHLKGSLEQGITSTLSPADPALKILDPAGELVAYVDYEGNLKTKGVIYLQGVPTDQIPQTGDTFIRNIGSYNYTNFNSTEGLTLAGAASVVDSVIDIVPGTFASVGTVWTSDQVPVGIGFEAQFSFSFDRDGADGLAFVIQNQSPTPFLGAGGNLGYGGIVNSLAVEFDTWANVDFDPPEFNGNHISVNTRGPVTPNSSDPAYSIGSSDFLSTTLEDGFIHTARIVYVPQDMSLQIFLDDVLEVEVFGFDLENHIDLDDGAAWVGITATSGTDAFQVAQLNTLQITPDRTMVIVLSGEQFLNPSDDLNTGLFDWGSDLRDDPEERYIPVMFNEDAVNFNGKGRVYDFIKLALDFPLPILGGTARFAMVGHSHGAGSVHDLADQLILHEDSAELRENNDIEIVMTAYVDGVAQPIFFCETALPPGTAYHVNLYQDLPFSLISNPFHGCTIPLANVDLDVNVQIMCVSGTEHFEIDDCAVVIDILDRNLHFAAYGDPLDVDYCNSGLMCDN